MSFSEGENYPVEYILGRSGSEELFQVRLASSGSEEEDVPFRVVRRTHQVASLSVSLLSWLQCLSTRI